MKTVFLGGGGKFVNTRLHALSKNGGVLKLGVPVWDPRKKDYNVLGSRFT